MARKAKLDIVVGRCEGCQKKPANRTARLCWGCWFDLPTRAKFPNPSKFLLRGHGQHFTGPADRPTPHNPGTEEKILELTRRASKGMGLWHEQDR